MHVIWWMTKGESSLRADARYTPSDGFETFPQPKLTEDMDRVGTELNSFRRELMERRRIGLTALYNVVHSESHADTDITRIRGIHVEIDESVREAYALDEEREQQIREYEQKIASAPLPAWREIDLAHGFHETPQGTRFTISPEARIEVLDKLLALNHYRHQQELERGLHAKKKPRPKPNPATQHAPALDDGTLFPPPDALF
jgi:hypothetical protein